MPHRVLLLLAFSLALVPGCAPKETKLEIADWYTAKSISGRSREATAEAGQVFLLVNARVTGKIPWEGDRVRFDKEDFAITTGSGRTITAAGLNKDLDGIQFSPPPSAFREIVFVLSEDDVKKGGLQFKCKDCPAAALTDDKKHSQ
jgi:hypothetical protein